MSQAIQINASSSVGQVVVHPLQMNAKGEFASCDRPNYIPDWIALANVAPARL